MNLVLSWDFRGGGSSSSGSIGGSSSSSGSGSNSGGGSSSSGGGGGSSSSSSSIKLFLYSQFFLYNHEILFKYKIITTSLESYRPRFRGMLKGVRAIFADNTDTRFWAVSNM